LATVRREKAKPTYALLRQPFVYAAAVFVLSLSLALNILFPDAGKEDSHEAVLRHSGSISAAHLVDVLSANPQVVKSWLTEKLDFSPPVIGFPSSEYSLLGGRVDVIHTAWSQPLSTKVIKTWSAYFAGRLKRNYSRSAIISPGGYHVCTWSNAECKIFSFRI
jgi:anti-sigma factor RsiW